VQCPTFKPQHLKKKRKYKSVFAHSLEITKKERNEGRRKGEEEGRQEERVLRPGVLVLVCSSSYWGG
jgi:hypothetical protein